MLHYNCRKQYHKEEILWNSKPSSKSAIPAKSSPQRRSSWINFFDPEKMAEAINLPENEEVLMLLDLGYAAEGTGPLASHTNRKPLEETVTYL